MGSKHACKHRHCGYAESTDARYVRHWSGRGQNSGVHFMEIDVYGCGGSGAATVHVDDHVGAFVLGEPVTVSFTDAQSCDSGGDCQWDDWIGIYPVATCCELAQLQNFVGGQYVSPAGTTLKHQKHRS